MAGTLQSRIDLTVAAIAYTWADVEDPRSPYQQRLAEGLEIELALPEVGTGVRPTRQVSVTMERVAVRASEPTLADLKMTGRLNGLPATATLVDLETGTAVLRQDGALRDVDAARGTFAVEEVEASMLQQLLPKRRLQDLFPNADLTAGGEDPRVIWVFREMRQVPLRRCQNIPPLPAAAVGADYGAFRVPLSGAAQLTINTVYVNKAVQTGTWTKQVVTPVAGQPAVIVVRFDKIPTDANGQEAEVRADVTSTEYNRPSGAARDVLTDATYGLGKPVVGASFTAAAAVYATAGYLVSGGMGPEPLRAEDVLNLLALRGAMVGHVAAGYTWTVDEAGLHTDAQYLGRDYGLGRGDSHWENIVQVTAQPEKPIEQCVNDYLLQGLRTEGFGTEAYLMTAHMVRSVPGTAKTEQNRFIGDATTLQKELGYRMTRMAAEETTLELEVDSEARVVPLNALLPVTVPALRLSATNPALPWMVHRIVGSRDRWVLGLVGYDSGQYGALAPAPQIAAGGLTLTDYRFTLPGYPTNFQVRTDLTRMTLTASGTYELAMTIQADAPSVNVSHLSFRAKLTGPSILWDFETLVPCTPGQTAVQGVLVGLGLGLHYDFVCFAVNLANDPAFQIGLFDAAFNFVANFPTPTNPTAFSTPGTPTLSQGTGKALQGSWPKVSEQGARYNVYLSKDGAASALVTENKQGTTWTYADASLAYNSSYRLQVRSVNPAGVLSAMSAFSSPVTLQQISNPHLGDGSVNDRTVDTINFNKIVGISVTANDITTGILTVNSATGAGGVAILCTGNGPRIQMRTASANPAQIEFQTDGGAPKFRLTGNTNDTGHLSLVPAGANDGYLDLGTTSLTWDVIRLEAGLGVLIGGPGNTYLQLYNDVNGNHTELGAGGSFVRINENGSILLSPGSQVVNLNRLAPDFEVAAPPFGAVSSGAPVVRDDVNLRLGIYSKTSPYGLLAYLWASNIH
jgi:hypothetical protein